MRKKNSGAEYASQRSELLLRNFRESIARQSRISAAKAFREVAEMPAPRFWVTEARATRIVRMMIKDMEVVEGMKPEKRQMYLEIYRRVREKLQANPSLPLGDAVFEVVNSPAPKTYLTVRYVAQIIYDGKKGGRK